MNEQVKDQAQRLRELVRLRGNPEPETPEVPQNRGMLPSPPDAQKNSRGTHRQASSQPGLKNTRVIAVTSGKGGVGKTSFTLNFALALQQLGQKVVVWDADFGFSNLHVLMGTQPEKNLTSIMDGEGDIWQILSRGTKGLEYISSGSGSKSMYQLKAGQLLHFLQQFLQLRGYADYLLIDLGAGLNDNSLKLLMTADEVVFVTTPQPTSMTDAYAVMKMMHLERASLNFHLLMNQVRNGKEGEPAVKKLQMVSERFLGVPLHLLGMLPDDVHVVKAVHHQTPYLVAFPASAIARKTVDLAVRYLERHDNAHQPPSQSFWNKFVYMLNKKG